MKRFAYMQQEKARYPVAMLCRALGVSASGYWAWRRREASPRRQEDIRLIQRIKAIHTDSGELYGAPEIHAELRASGIRCGRKRVARLMRAEGLRGCHRRNKRRLTWRDPLAAPSPDLVSRQFRAMLPNRLWVSDITYVPTREGFLYLAMVMDVFSRRVVGWSMSERMDVRLVDAALSMAVLTRKPKPGLIRHSDRGRQYTSLVYRALCQRHGIVTSMGKAGDCYDNAMAESFFATLECELLDRHRFRTRAEARTAIFKFIEGFYNRRRVHSALGYLSPENYERRHALTGIGKLQTVH